MLFIFFVRFHDEGNLLFQRERDYLKLLNILLAVFARLKTLLEIISFEVYF